MLTLGGRRFIYTHFRSIVTQERDYLRSYLVYVVVRVFYCLTSPSVPGWTLQAAVHLGRLSDPDEAHTVGR